MLNETRPNFSQIVCGSQPVRTAFAAHSPTRRWWNLILMLHGKPTSVSLSDEVRAKRVADGFKFYALLYRLLAVIFLLLAPAFALFNIANDSAASLYWASGSLLAAVYLWCVSGLGYVGASLYGSDQAQSRSALLAFMVMIVAFLSMFVAVVSVVAQQTHSLPTVPNLTGVCALFIFGIGSYMIEIIYLATGHPLPTTDHPIPTTEA